MPRIEGFETAALNYPGARLRGCSRLLEEQVLPASARLGASQRIDIDLAIDGGRLLETVYHHVNRGSRSRRAATSRETRGLQLTRSGETISAAAGSSAERAMLRWNQSCKHGSRCQRHRDSENLQLPVGEQRARGERGS